MNADVQAAAIERIAEWLCSFEMNFTWRELPERDRGFYREHASELWELLGLEQVGWVTKNEDAQDLYRREPPLAYPEMWEPVFRLALPQEDE